MGSKIKFDPQKYRPIPNKGFPDLDESSVAYQEWWSEQQDRCINGFKPKGMPNIASVRPSFKEFVDHE